MVKRIPCKTLLLVRFQFSAIIKTCSFEPPPSGRGSARHRPRRAGKGCNAAGQTLFLSQAGGGSGSALSAARLAVKLHLKALDKGPEADKYFHSLSDKQRADLLKVRMQTISRFKTTAGGAPQPRSQPAAKIYNNKNNKPNKPNNKDFWKYFLLFILCFTITNILHFLGYSYITDLISIYKIGLILNLLFGYIIVYNSIAMYLVNYNPQREIEKHTIYKYLPKFTKNFLSLYDTNHPELIKAMNKLLIGGIVVSILIMVIINVVLLFI